MKTSKLFIVAILFPFFSFAQGGIEIVPFAGYMFGGSVKFYEGEINLSNGLNYGGSLIIPVQEILDVEINYTGMQGDAQFNPYSNYSDYESESSGIVTNYFQVGVLKSLILDNPNIKPFGSVSVGATMFNLKEYTDTWSFSMTLGVGVKIMFSDHVGIMLRGRLLMPMTYGGTGAYCGIGTGGGSCGLSLNGYVQPFQGDFNGGLIIALGK